MHNDHVSTKKLLMLATSSDGDRLSLPRAVGEASMEVSIWLYAAEVHGHAEDQQGTEETSSWLRWQSVDIRKLIEDAGLERYRLGCKDWTVLETRLERFCPKSQSAIIWIPYIGLFVLDLKSMRIRRAAGDTHGDIWPYEIDLTHWYPSIK
jgi:LmbE family N-acetylglucosaminyl deacetylase